MYYTCRKNGILEFFRCRVYSTPAGRGLPVIGEVCQSEAITAAGDVRYICRIMSSNLYWKNQWKVLLPSTDRWRKSFIFIDSERTDSCWVVVMLSLENKSWRRMVKNFKLLLIQKTKWSIFQKQKLKVRDSFVKLKKISKIRKLTDTAFYHKWS